MALILNKEQAETVCGAMSTLKNFSHQELSDDVLVKKQPNGIVTVFHGTVVREVYPDQSAFAAAYGLQ